MTQHLCTGVPLRSTGLLLSFLLTFCGRAFAVDLTVVRQPAAADNGMLNRPPAGCAAGSAIVRLSSDGGERVLTPGFVAACDPAVSFDGKQILFAGFQDGDRSQIWRMDADGGNLIRLSSGIDVFTSPLWIGSLFHLDDEAPTERIAYLSTGTGWLDELSSGPVIALFTADLDGSHPLRISFHPNSDLDPDVLPNGRLIFPSWRSITGGTLGTRLSLMTVNNDGTDLMAFYDNHDGPPQPHSVKVGGDGRVYFVEADGTSPLGGGDLAYVSLRRPLHSRTLLSVAGDGSYLDPLPLADGGLLASYRPTGSDTVYGLYRVDPATGDRLDLVHGNSEFHYLDAQELAPHPKVKGRSSVVDTTKTTGVFYCISSHLSDRPGLERLRAGEASILRVIEGVAPDPTLARWSQRTLGEVPLEQDGSFHIEVSSGTPIRFELLDEAGVEIARQDSWTWVMPREWRGCIGCHEDREMVVPNTLADAVVKPAFRLDQFQEEAP
jgi:hypothetical protein